MVQELPRSPVSAETWIMIMQPALAVLVNQSAQKVAPKHPALGGHQAGRRMARSRRLHVERQVRTMTVDVLDVGVQDELEVVSSEGEDAMSHSRWSVPAYRMPEPIGL
jgi:hypothetical protein